MQNESTSLKVKGFLLDSCKISESPAKESLVELLHAAFSDERKLWQFFGLSGRREVLDFLNVAFPAVSALSDGGSRSIKEALWEKLGIDGGPDSLIKNGPDSTYDEKLLPHAKSYLSNNTPDFELRPISLAMARFFAAADFVGENSPQSPISLAKNVLDWISPNEFANLTPMEISNNVSIHAKMCDYIDANTAWGDEDCEIFSRILKNLISNRGYHLWENLGFTGKPEMRSAIRTFFPAWADIIENDVENKLGTCNRQKLSRILNSPVIFQCSHCSAYRAPVLERYVGSPLVAMKMERTFEKVDLPPKQYFISRAVVLFGLLFPDAGTASQILGITRDEFDRYRSLAG